MKDITPKNQPDLMDYHHGKRHTLLYVAGIFAVLVVVSLVIISMRKGMNPMTPEEKLRALEKNAEPVLTTPAQQAANMDALRKGNKAPASPAQQQDMLNTLAQ